MWSNYNFRNFRINEINRPNDTRTPKKFSSVADDGGPTYGDVPHLSSTHFGVKPSVRSPADGCSDGKFQARFPDRLGPKYRLLPNFYSMHEDKATMQRDAGPFGLPCMLSHDDMK